MTNDTAKYLKKMKKAAKLLLYKRHRQPGVKGWELKKAFGKDFIKIIELLNEELDGLDLQVKIVWDTSEEPVEATKEKLEGARFYITLKKPMSRSELIMAGWRIDDVAALTVSVAYIISKQGKASRNEIEKILREKFPKWKVDYNLNRFIRKGYLTQDDDNVLYLNWRARAEIDQKTLLKLVLAERV